MQTHKITYRYNISTHNIYTVHHNVHAMNACTMRGRMAITSAHVLGELIHEGTCKKQLVCTQCEDSQHSLSRYLNTVNPVGRGV